MMRRFWALGVVLAAFVFSTPAMSGFHGDEVGNGGYIRYPVAEKEPSIAFTATLLANGQRIALSAVQLSVKSKTEYQEVVVGKYLIRIWLFQKQPNGTYRVSVAVWDRSQTSGLPVSPFARAFPPGKSLGSISNAGKEPKFLEDLSLQGAIKDGNQVLLINIKST